VTEPGDDLLRIIREVIVDELRNGQVGRAIPQHLRGTVSVVEESIRTCSVRIGGSDIATPGVRWGQDTTTPVVGDEVLVARDLGGRYIILARL
jgi:hypothetical protein